MNPHVDAGQAAAAQEGPRQQIERAAAGLLYTSESDYVFDYVTLPSVPGQVLEPDQIAALVGHAGQPVAEITLDEFFARHIERVHPADPASVALVPRYRALEETLRAALGNVRVFRIGTSQIDCYVLGTVPGGLAGLHTVSVET
jgi:Nuclease A inhibitor-like protein